MAANLACLCRWHHRARTDQVWNVTMDPDGTQHWSGPHAQQLHSVPVGMPTTGHGPPGTAGPVLPRSPINPTQIVAPDDEPPDDHPPERFTPAGHWPDDPTTPTDLETLEALVDADQRRHTRPAHATRRPTTTGGRTHQPRRRRPTTF